MRRTCTHLQRVSYLHLIVAGILRLDAFADVEVVFGKVLGRGDLCG